MTKITQLPVATTISNNGVFVIVDQGITKQLTWQTLRSTGLKGDTGTPGSTGTTGATGPMGTAASLTVGTVTTGSTASVIISPTTSTSVYKIDFVLPLGPKGDTGTYVPLVATSSVLGGVKIGSNINVSNSGTISVANPFVLNTATANILGGVKIGSGIAIAADGTISASSQYILTTASGATLGGVKIGAGIGVAVDGTISVTTGAFALQTATSVVLGGIKIGAGLQASSSGTVSVNTASLGIVSYTLPAATTSTLGGVIIPAVATSGIINTTGTIKLSTASITQLGGVKIGTGISITADGTISATTATAYSLPTASGSLLGGVKIGTGVSVAVDGTISVNTGTPYTLPTATTATLGGIKIDGVTVVISNGVISAPATGLNSRVSVVTTSSSIAYQSSVPITVTAAKSYALISIQASTGSWVTVYSSGAAQTADSARSISVDPTPGSGVIAEAITTVSNTTYFSPAVIGYNNDNVLSSNMYLKVYNNSASTASITVTLTYLKLEA